MNELVEKLINGWWFDDRWINETWVIELFVQLINEKVEELRMNWKTDWWKD